MEKGRVYKAGSGELIAWGVRFFFGSEKGLCYQHVGRKLRPVGTKKVIPWGAITKVEALEDDSVYVETQALKRYYLKPKDSAQPAVEAWQWATALCSSECSRRRTAQHRPPSLQSPDAALTPARAPQDGATGRQRGGRLRRPDHAYGYVGGAAEGASPPPRPLAVLRLPPPLLPLPPPHSLFPSAPQNAHTTFPLRPSVSLKDVTQAISGHSSPR